MAKTASTRCNGFESSLGVMVASACGELRIPATSHGRQPVETAAWRPSRRLRHLPVSTEPVIAAERYGLHLLPELEQVSIRLRMEDPSRMSLENTCCTCLYQNWIASLV